MNYINFYFEVKIKMIEKKRNQ